MAKKHRDTHTYKTFREVTDRLDGIVADVRSKDTSLEHSLDLFDEAISLGSRAVELVDHTDFSPEEKERLADDSAKDMVEAQEREGENLAQGLLEKRGQEVIAEGDVPEVPQALEETMDDALADKPIPGDPEATA